MQEKIEKIKEIITNPMQEKDIIVDSVTWEKEGKYNYLKIVLDKVNGIDIDAIVEATHIINPILDENDLIEDEYILDISSKERG